MIENNLALKPQSAIPASCFVPGADNARAYRNALGQFGTGVTIVTAVGHEGPIGMTVNSFASVSLEPALVLWSLAKSTRRFQAFATAENYAIHVLREDQSALAQLFARSANAFDQIDWQPGEEAVPRLHDCLARFACRRETVHDAADHVIVLGRVREVTTQPGEPLLFAKGKFGGFAAG